jgi:hypothetical protein
MCLESFSKRRNTLCQLLVPATDCCQSAWPYYQLDETGNGENKKTPESIVLASSSHAPRLCVTFLDIPKDVNAKAEITKVKELHVAAAPRTSTGTHSSYILYWRELLGYLFFLRLSRVSTLYSKRVSIVVVLQVVAGRSRSLVEIPSSGAIMSRGRVDNECRPTK